MAKSPKQTRAATWFTTGRRRVAVIILWWAQNAATVWAGVEMQHLCGIELGVSEGMLAVQETMGAERSNSQNEGDWRSEAKQNSSIN